MQHNEETRTELHTVLNTVISVCSQHISCQRQILVFSVYPIYMQSILMTYLYVQSIFEVRCLASYLQLVLAPIITVGVRDNCCNQTVCLYRLVQYSNILYKYIPCRHHFIPPLICVHFMCILMLIAYKTQGNRFTVTVVP